MSYNKVYVAHWCSNVLCDLFNSGQQPRTDFIILLSGDLALNYNKCPCCNYKLTSELDVAVEDLLKELKIELKK